MTQIALPLAWPDPADERDFLLSDANEAAARHLNHWSLWPVAATLLTGPRKSGRSLLGRIFAAKTGATLIDDAEDKPEDELFHAWNRAQGSRRPLLLIADSAPPAWRIVLPDLASRLAATPRIVIREPDDMLARALFEKLLVRRGVPPPPGLVAWLLPRIERSYVGIQRAVDRLDETALARRGGRLTLAAARRAFEVPAGPAEPDGD